MVFNTSAAYNSQIAPLTPKSSSTTPPSYNPVPLNLHIQEQRIQSLSNFLYRSVRLAMPRHPNLPLNRYNRVSFQRYCYHFVKGSLVSPNVVLLAMDYLRRLQCNTSSTMLQTRSAIEVTVVAVMMASKYLLDHTYNNRSWALLSGVELASLNQMERELLSNLDYNLNISQEWFAGWQRLWYRHCPMPTLPTPQVPSVVGIKRASPHATTLPPLKMVNITYPTPPTCSRPILPPPAHFSRSLPYPNQYQL